MTFAQLLKTINKKRGMVVLFGADAEDVFKNLVIFRESAIRFFFEKEPEHKKQPNEITSFINDLLDYSKQGYCVLIATWSPLVLDLINPEDIYYCDKDDVVSQPFIEDSKIREMLGFMRAGEIWINNISLFGEVT